MSSEYLTNDGPFHSFNVRDAAELAIRMTEEEACLSALINRQALDAVLAGGGTGRAVSIRVPSALIARTRGLDETKAAIQLDSLTEREVTITLGEHVYSAVALSEGEMNLDLQSFSDQVLRPQAEAVVDHIENAVSEMLMAETPNATVGAKWDPENPIEVFTALRKELRERQVPQAGMNVVVGTEVYATLLSSDKVTIASAAGDTKGLRDANVGKLRGFTIMESTRVDENDIIAFHKDAFVLAVRAPQVPSGQAGHISTTGGMQLRYLTDYDTLHTAHRSVVSTFAGVKKMPLYKVERDYSAHTAEVVEVPEGAVVRVNVTE